MNTPFEQIVALGFEECGKWEMIGGQIRYQIWKHANEREVLYAFVCNGNLLYIGKTIRMLRKRMYNYQNPGPRQRTSIANHKRIFNALVDNKQIAIYAFVPTETVSYRDWKVNISAGLEDILIAKLTPPWNGSTKLEAQD